MPLYSYHYLKNGKRRGSIEAATLQEAKLKLRQQHILVTDIGERGRGKTAFSNNHLLQFTLQLAQLLEAGLPLYESLLAIEGESQRESYHPILLHLCQQIQQGELLSEAMNAHPKIFSPLYRAMIAAGEASGDLHSSLQKLTGLLQKRQALRKTLLASLLYPAVLASFCLVVITLLLLFAIPSMKTLFDGQPVSGITYLVFAASDHWIFLPLTLTPLLLLFKPTIRRKIPFIRTILLYSSLTRFARTLSSLLKSHVPLIDALALSRNVVEDPALQTILKRAEKEVIQGSTLSFELKKEPLIPSLFTRLLHIGEESANPASMLEKIADHYQNELEKRLLRITTLAQPTILIVMGAIIGLIMLAVLLPLTDASHFF